MVIRHAFRECIVKLIMQQNIPVKTTIVYTSIGTLGGVLLLRYPDQIIYLISRVIENKYK